MAAHQRWGFGYFVTRAVSVDVMGDVIAGVRPGAQPAADSGASAE